MVLVTGPAGAGRSSTLNVLEDAGFEAIDNIPMRMLRALLEAPGQLRPMALGVDLRNRDFSTDRVIELMSDMRSRPDVDIELLYLDCATNVLLRRFSETRRRHPMAATATPVEGIVREKELLEPVLALADVLIDTSELSPHDLRAELEQWFAPQGGSDMAVSVHSFSYKRGLPRGLDMVLDCRFLQNPYWEEGLRALDGRDQRVADYVAQDARFASFRDKVVELALLLLPAYEAEGKAYLAIGFGCTGGQHRSVAMAETLARALADGGWPVSIRHRELERRGAAEAPRGDLQARVGE